MKVEREEFERFYEKVDPWQVLNKNIRNYVVKRVLRKNLKSNYKTIEIGCGEGNFSIEINKICNKSVGIDISSKAIERARTLELRNYIFKQGDLLNFDYSKYDCVIALEVIYYLAKKEQREFFEKICKNKLIIFSAPIIEKNQYRSYFTEQELKKIFYNNKLKIIEEKNLSFFGQKSIVHRILNKLLFSNYLSENFISYKILQALPSGLIYQKIYILKSVN